jgi:DDE_Tnp_1-associated
MNLIEHLKQVPDYRTQPQYPLWVILLLIIMGILSGCQGYRALEDFVARHQSSLLKLLNLPYKRLPSFTTLRRIMVRLNYQHLTERFNDWSAETYPTLAAEQVPIDGKSLKSTVVDEFKSQQDFINVVSAFSVQQGVVLRLEPVHNGEVSEIETVQQLLDNLQVSGVCFSMDALHTQKKQFNRSLRLTMTI